MTRRVMRGLAAGAAMTLAVAGSAEANRSGIVGRAQIGCGGGGCHTGGDVPTVELIGPSMVAPGATADFVLRVSGGQSAAGANIEASAGLLLPGEGLSARSGQLVHAGDAVTYTEGAAEFSFTFEAPAAPGTIDLFAAGNSVDNNFQSSGDGWGLASATITVGNGVAPDGGVDPDAGESDAGGGGDTGCRQRPGGADGLPAVPLLLVVGGLLFSRRRR